MVHGCGKEACKALDGEKTEERGDLEFCWGDRESTLALNHVPQSDSPTRYPSHITTSTMRFWPPLVLLPLSVQAGKNLVQDFLHRKCGNEEQAVWFYEGHLVDPLDGTKISSVQGLEIVDRIGVHADDPSQFQRKCRDIQVGKLLSDGESQKAIGSMLSSKAFCYATLQQDDVQQSPPKLLQNYSPPRKGAPKRKVPVDEAFTRTDSVVSILAAGRRCWLHNELLSRGGSSALGSVNYNDDTANDDDPLELQVFSMPKELTTDLLNTANEDDATQEPRRRSKLIQFGATPAQTKSRGAREIYRFMKDGRMRYTRYGEGPVWYGVGRMCQLELIGTRLAPGQSLPHNKLITQLVLSSSDLLDRRIGNDSHTKDKGNESEDPVFRYYCDALHGGGKHRLDSCEAYQRHYDDLAMSRTINSFRQQKKRAGRGWFERLRRATSFSA